MSAPRQFVSLCSFVFDGQIYVDFGRRGWVYEKADNNMEFLEAKGLRHVLFISACESQASMAFFAQ